MLVEEMPKYVRSAFISQEDLFAGKWDSHLDKLLAQPKPKKKAETNGAERRRRHTARSARQAATQAERKAPDEGIEFGRANRSTVRTSRTPERSHSLHRSPATTSAGSSPFRSKSAAGPPGEKFSETRSSLNPT